MSLGLVDFKDKGRPKILSFAREEIMVSDKFSPDRFISALPQAIDKVFKKLKDSTQARFDGVEVFLSAPWYVSQTVVIKTAEERPFAMSKKLIDKHIGNEIKKFMDETGKTYSQLAPPPYQLLENIAIKIKVNGYEVSENYNKSGRVLEITALLSMSPEAIIKTVSDGCHSLRHGLKINFHSTAYCHYFSINQILPNNDNYILINIGGEMSEATIVWHDILLETAVIPVGRNVYLRKLSADLKTVPEEIHSTLRLHSEGEATEKSAERMETAIQPVKKIWLEAFKKVIESALNEYFLPEAVFVVSDESYVSDIFLKSINEEDLRAYTLSDNAFEIISLRNKLQADDNSLSIVLESRYCDKIANGL